MLGHWHQLLQSQPNLSQMGIATNTMIHYKQDLEVSGEIPLMTDMPFVQSEAHADVQISRFNTFITQFDLFSYQNPPPDLLFFLRSWEITLTHKKINLSMSSEDMEGVK